MAFSFKPAVYKSSVLVEFPRPVLSVRIQDAWDFEQFKVPLADGDFLAGHSRDGVDISIEGQVGTDAGVLKADEEAMFTTIESLRNTLDVSVSGDKYLLFLYYDVSTATYRHFKSCSTVRFDYDLSNKHLFSYSVVIHAEDSTIYATAPS